MDLRNYHGPGPRAPLVLSLLALPTSIVAELTTSILHTSPSPLLELRQATPTNDDSLPTPTSPSTDQDDNQDDDNNSMHIFNYYFLLIAIFIAILLLAFVFAGRRRKRRTLRLLNTRQEALRRDLEGWSNVRPIPTRNNTSQPSRWAVGTRNWRSRNVNDPGVTRHDEGLDDLGEAPPPYNPGDKPPSIALSRRATQASEGEAPDSEAALAVPLRTLSRSNTEHNPPGYLESVGNSGSEDSGQITRPDAAVTPTTDGFGSARRLLDRTEGSSH